MINQHTADFRWYLGIFLLSLVVHVSLMVIFAPWEESNLTNVIMQGDAKGYQRYADWIRTGEISPTDRVLTDRTPGYPFFIAVHQSFFGKDATATIITQVFLGSISSVLVMYLTSIWLNQPVARLAGILYALDPQSASFALSLSPDILFVFLFLSCCIFLSRVLRDRGSTYLNVIFAALTLGFSVYVKPVTIYFPVILILFLAFRTRPLIRWAKMAALACIVVTMTLAPWYIYNYNKYNHFAFTSKGGSHLLYWVVTYLESAKTGKSSFEVRRTFEEQVAAQVKNPQDFFARSQIESKIATNYLSKHFFLFVEQSLRGMVFSFTNIGSKYFAELIHTESNDLPFQYFAPPNLLEMVSGFIKQKSTGELIILIVVGSYLLITYALTLVGLVCITRNRDWLYLSFVILICSYFLALIGPIGLARYRYAFSGIYIGIAGLGLYRLLPKTVPKNVA